MICKASCFVNDNDHIVESFHSLIKDRRTRVYTLLSLLFYLYTTSSCDVDQMEWLKSYIFNMGLDYIFKFGDY